MDIRTEVGKLIDLANTPGTTQKQCDDAARPLIQHLISTGKLPSDRAFVEWQGALEFDLIHICHTEGEPMLETYKESWLTINRDGSIT